MILFTDAAGIAPNPKRVTIFIAEKNIEIETRKFDIGKGEQKGEAYTAINSRQRLPALQLDDGTILTETVAICRYLEELYPDPPLMGVNPVDRAIVEMWQRRIELEFFMPVAFAFRNLHPRAIALEPIQVSEWGELSQVRALDAMEKLNAELSTRDFITGDNFTIADITAICAYMFLSAARIKVPDALGNLINWAERIKTRPALSSDKR